MSERESAAPEKTFGQYVILSEDHRELLDTLKSKRRMSYSETIRRGIEIVASQLAPATVSQQTAGNHFEG